METNDLWYYSIIYIQRNLNYENDQLVIANLTIERWDVRDEIVWASRFETLLMHFTRT